ncbi:MAG: DevR family CRISPR-associated autoregulator [Blastocatellia bacterium]
MPTHYLYGTILTSEAVAANNRGDNMGNTSTLQKVFHQDDVHTTVSAEAIRFALRYRFQLENEKKVNRSYDPESGKLNFADEKRTYLASENPEMFIDDDIMGFMDAAAAKKEREEEDEDENDQPEATAKPAKGAKKQKAKGTTTKRPSPLAIGRAVSLRPYRGEISFNAVSGEKVKGKLSLYNAEMHTTEYQYSFGLNLKDVKNKENISHVIAAIIDPPPVAGNHARFAYDFSPASIVLRVTNAHSSKIQNCFEHDESNRTYTVNSLIYKVENGDIPAEELIIGGAIANTPEGKRLEELKVKVVKGVISAAQEARNRIAKLGDDFKALSNS